MVIMTRDKNMLVTDKAIVDRSDLRVSLNRISGKSHGVKVIYTPIIE